MVISIIMVASANPAAAASRTGLLARAEALGALFCRRVALPWAVGTSVFTLACGQDSSAHTSSSVAAVCGDQSLFALVSAMVGLSLVVDTLVAILMELTVFDISLLSDSPVAASHGRAQSMLVVLKCVATAIICSPSGAVSSPVRCLTAVGAGLLVSYLFVSRVPYATKSVNALFFASGAACSWAGLVGLLPLVSTSTGMLMPATFGTALMAAAAFAWATYTLDATAGTLHLDGSGGTSPLTVWTSILWVRERLRTADRERRKESALGFSREARKAALDGTAVVAAKPKTSVIEDLVSATASLAGLSTPASVTAAAAKGRLESRELSKADALEKEALLGVAYIEDLFVGHAMAQIIVSRFWHQLFSLSHFKERQALTTAKSLSAAYDVRFFFAVCMEAIKSKDEGPGAGGHNVPSANASGTKDIFDRARFEKAHEAALDAMLTAYEAQTRVMRLVVAGRYDFGALHNRVALGFGRAMARAHEAVESMLAVNSESSHALILATEFFMELAGDATRASELQQRNNRLIDTQRRQAERKVQHLAFGAPCEEISPTDETNAVFTIATEVTRLGEITAFNKSASHIFGRSDFLGENISGIIPQPIAAVHDRFLQRFLRTGTARLLDSTRFLVARHADATIFPVRFRLFETPPSVQDVRPKLTGIISTVNSDEGMIIVGDDSYDFAITAACRRTCEIIGVSGMDVEQGAVTGAMILPQLFLRPTSDEERHAHRAAPPHGAAASVAQRSLYQRPGQSKRGGTAQFEGVPAWAADMPLRLQAAFAKPTRAFLVPPDQGQEGAGEAAPPDFPGAPYHAADATDGGGLPSPLGRSVGILPVSPTNAAVAASRPRRTSSGDGPPAPPRRPSIGRPRRPSISDDLLDGLLDESGAGGAARRGSASGPPALLRHGSSRLNIGSTYANAVPITVRCYALPKPTPTDPTGVLVCWTSRDQGKAAAAAVGANRKAASRASDPIGMSPAARGAVASGTTRDPSVSKSDTGVFQSRIADAAAAAAGVPAKGAKRRLSAQGGASTRDNASVNDDARSKSSFSSAGALKAARRRIENLARHPSGAFACMRSNAVLVALLSAVLMVVVLVVVGDTTASVKRHQGAVLSALELVREAQETAAVVHATAAYNRAVLAGSRSSAPGVNATADVARAYGSEPFPYVAWPVTSRNATLWRLGEAAQLQYAASITLRAASRAVSPAEYKRITDLDSVCAYEEEPEAFGSGYAARYPIRLTPLDLSSTPGGTSFLFGPNCTGVGMSVSNLLDTILGSLEGLRGRDVSAVLPSDYDARFVVANAVGVLAGSLNQTVEPSVGRLTADLSAVLNTSLRGLVIAFAGLLVVVLIVAIVCSRRLVQEQRLVLQILFNLPKSIARAVHGAGLDRHRGLVAKKAEIGNPRSGMLADDPDAGGGPANESDEEGEGGPGQQPKDLGEHASIAMDSTFLGNTSDFTVGPIGQPPGDQYVVRAGIPGSEAMVEGQREALQLAVTAAPHRAAGSTSRARMQRPGAASRNPSLRSGSKDRPGLAMAALAAGEPRGGVRPDLTDYDADGRPSETGMMGGDDFMDDPTGIGAGRRGSIGSVQSFAQAAAAAREGTGPAARHGRPSGTDGARTTTMTDRRCFATRLGFATTLPALITAAWLVAIVVVEANLHVAVANDMERAVHALELSVWLGRHAHAAAWAAADPSVQATEGAASRAAMARQLDVTRHAIELRSGFLLHGGASELRAKVRAGSAMSWLDAFISTAELPAAKEGTATFAALTGDACSAVMQAASTSYYNTDGRRLITPSLCASVHDGVLRQGLTTALARLMSRSRALQAALGRLWAARDAVRLTVTSAGSAAAAAVNTTREEATVVEAGATSWALLADVLQVSDPWLRLGSTDLGTLLATDMSARANAAYATQRDLTISAAVLVVVATIVVLSTTLFTAQSAIRSARRLLHFLPEVAYNHMGVASALDRAYEVLGINARI